MKRIWRRVFLVLTAAFLVAIVVQVFFAGLMMFGEPGGSGLHADMGWTVHFVVFVLPILAALAGAGSRIIVLSSILALATFAQPYITFLRDASPALAALHPVNALLIFLMAVLLVRRALRLTRSEVHPGAHPVA